jgi:septum formation inhibitor-activating ATPase MinD
MNHVVLLGDSINGQRIADNMHIEVVAELPLDRDTVLRSINRGEPLLLQDRSNPISRQMIKITGEVMKKLVEGEPEE